MLPIGTIRTRLNQLLVHVSEEENSGESMNITFIFIAENDKSTMVKWIQDRKNYYC